MLKRALLIPAFVVCLVAYGCSQTNEEVPVQSKPADSPANSEQPLQQESIERIVLSARQGLPKPQPLTKHSLQRRQIANSHMVMSDWSGRREDNYQHLVDNAVMLVSEQPVSTFSADVDTASYANVRRWLENGELPPKDAVRVEEMVNYFHYNYPKAESEDLPIRLDTLLTQAPWDQHRHLLRIGVNSFQVGMSERPPANIVALVDVSGSMRSDDKLPLVQQSLQLMLGQLKDDDRVALVTYAGGAQVILESTLVKDKAKIIKAIQSLNAGGSTNGGAGIELAYAQAHQGFITAGINQIMLMSDGDLNVGMTNLDDLKQQIEIKRRQGVHFSTLGFGQGNYNDHLMEQLADLGNGMAGYIDSLHEAQKLLVDQLGSSLQTIAHDVKFQVEFNPAVVAEYRLIGYENRQLNREDFNQDQKDAGDLGAGHTVTALYELTLVGSPRRIEPLVFQPEPAQSIELEQSLAEVRVRYKLSLGEASTLVTQRVKSSEVVEFSQLNGDDTFAISVAGFAQKLRHSEYLAQQSYAELIQWANQSKGSDPFGYRAECVQLMRLAQSLWQQEQMADTTFHPERRDSDLDEGALKKQRKSTLNKSQTIR